MGFWGLQIDTSMPPAATLTTIINEGRNNMYNLKNIMRRAWELRREKSYTMMTALRIAWAEAKGMKVYTFRLENARAQISAYLMKLVKAVKDVHDQHKLEILRAALMLPMDETGMVVTDGKTVGLCKYACRNA